MLAMEQLLTTIHSAATSEVTNTLHFADIAVGTNSVTLAVDWPSDLFAVGTTIDLLATTSLVESVWGWRQAHDVAAGETNWTVTVEKESVSLFYKAVVRDSLADMDDFDGGGPAAARRRRVAGVETAAMEYQVPDSGSYTI